jgi:hypothetical protein
VTIVADALRPPAALRTLLEDAIDYAGLFPPAALAMDAAVEAYASYRRDAAAWALGRFIVPATRLDDFADARRAREPESLALDRWRLSVLLGADARGDLASVAAFNLRNVHGSAGSVVDAIELRAGDADAVRELTALRPPSIDTFVEIPLSVDPEPLVAAIRDGGAMAKARTGGVTADAFPSAESLLRFIQACVRAAVPFKVTAGLHHPMRAEYRLTYEPESAAATMFGYLNVFLATAFVREGMGDADALALLGERDSSSIRVDDDGVTWRGRTLSRDAVAATRRTDIRGFGSCSFREPVDELSALSLGA